MDHAITVRDLIGPAVGIGGIICVIIVLAVLASIFADAWKH